MKSYLSRAALLALLLASAPLRADGPAVRESTGLDGTWQLLSVTLSGKDLESDAIKGKSIRIAGDALTSWSGDKELDRATLKVGAGTDLKTIDAIFTSGPLAGKTFPGIWKLEGNFLMLCYGASGTERPRGFTSQPGSETILFTYKRQGDPAVAAPQTPPAPEPDRRQAQLEARLAALTREMEALKQAARSQPGEGPAQLTVRVYTLRQADAQEVGRTLQQLFTQAEMARIRVSPHASSNALLIRGSESDLEWIEATISRLDEMARDKKKGEGKP